MKKLLKLTTGLGDFYIVHENVQEAIDFLERELSKANYGYTKNQKVTSVQIISSEITVWHDGKLNFSSETKLLIQR